MSPLLGGGSFIWRHLDGTECVHRLAADPLAAEGLRCEVTNLDVWQDDGGPRTGKITVVLNNDEGRFTPDEPVRPFFAPPPPSAYLGAPGRNRHRAEKPGMFTSWPQALAHVALWVVGTGVIVGCLIGVAWGVIYLLS